MLQTNSSFGRCDQKGLSSDTSSLVLVMACYSPSTKAMPELILAKTPYGIPGHNELIYFSSSDCFTCQEKNPPVSLKKGTFSFPWYDHTLLDYFTVSLHSPDGRQFACRQGCARDCQWPLENSGNSHHSHEPTMHCGLLRIHCCRHPQCISRPANNTSGDNMFHISLIILQPTGLDCVAV